MGLMDRLFGASPTFMNGDPVQVPQALGAEGVFYDINDPRVLDFLRDGNPTSSGRYVNERSAMQNPTFNRAVTLISSSIGMLPTNLMVKKPDGKTEKAETHPAFNLLRSQGKPNSFQDPFKFKTYMQGRALMHGDAFAHIVPGLRGPQALIPMDPCKVDVRLTDRFELEYDWRPSKGSKQTFKADEVMHLRSPWSNDGITGVGLLKQLAEALGLAESADDAAARLMRNGSYVGGVLKHPKNLSAEAAQRLRGQFEDRHAGTENAGKWIVTEEGMDATPFGMSGRDAQGLENRRYQAEEVSRGTGVPRPLLMFDETSWGTGIEQLGLFFVTYCLLPWFKAWEETLARSLLSETERQNHFFKFNEAALLRGSLKDQAEFLKAAIGGPGQGGWIVPDEARDTLDMNPMEHDAGKRPAWVQMENNDNVPTE